MSAFQVILYVKDQGRARDFYSATLGATPTLDVPGMTEYDLGGATLGLMPSADMAELLPGRLDTCGAQRCELYLRRVDSGAVIRRACLHGGRLVSPFQARPWGEVVAYVLDPDGHVLAVAQASPRPSGGLRRPSLGCPTQPCERTVGSTWRPSGPGFHATSHRNPAGSAK